MSKTYKVSYKTYFNERLRQVFFHGELTHPLYVQVTFDRKSIIFKSYYFELFSNDRYESYSNGKVSAPDISEIIKKENALIDFVIDKTLSSFSLKRFQKEYEFYCQDLCEITEGHFIYYLLVFFNGKGMPALAGALKEGCKSQIVYDVVREMEGAMNSSLYKELVNDSLVEGPPYLPLYGFMLQMKKWPMLSLSMMEWENVEIKAMYAAFVSKHYPDHNVDKIIELTNEWFVYLRKGRK